jgi:putative SOS response-associated peptidase YedK
MAIIHNTKKRMPLILATANERKWVQPEISETEIKSMINQYPESDMEAAVVEQKNNHPEETGRLF